MKHINGWKRIGVVASVAWAIGAYIHVFDTVYGEGQRISIESDKICDDSAYNGGTSESVEQCDIDMNKSLDEDRHVSAEYAAFGAVLPIPIGWGFAYLLIFIVRWIKRGFKASADRS